jgi:hypothetical protein
VALNRLLVAVLGVPVWLGVTVAVRSRRRSAGCPARGALHPGRDALFSGAWPSPRHGAQRSGRAPCLPCRSRRRSAGCPVRRSTVRFGAALGVLVAPALGQPPGAALDLMVCGPCVLRARQGGTQLAPRCGSLRSGQARRSPCRSRRHWTTRLGTARQSRWRLAGSSVRRLSSWWQQQHKLKVVDCYILRLLRLICLLHLLFLCPREVLERWHEAAVPRCLSSSSAPRRAT